MAGNQEDKGQSREESSALVRVVFYLFEAGSPCSSCWPRNHYVDQAGLDLTETHPPLPPECFSLFLFVLNQTWGQMTIKHSYHQDQELTLLFKMEVPGRL